MQLAVRSYLTAGVAMVGATAALQGLSQTVGVLLGSGWDDYDGKGNAPAPKPPLVGLDPLTFGDPLSDIAESAGITKLRENLKSLAVDKIVKQLQGLDIGTETAADNSTAVAVSVDTAADGAVDTAVDSAAATGVAAANELTHATTNKTVAVSVEKPATATSTAGATTTSTTEDADSDETAGATTESADDAEATGTKTPKAQTRKKATAGRTDPSSNSPQRNLVKGVKDAVKNVRDGLGGNKSRTSNESASSSSDSSTGSSSTNSSTKKDNAKSDSKKDKKAKKDSGKD
ncbi:hypothetical protein [Mycolicibacterium lutetiense]|uniref:Sec-independent protein translocase protein TatA n=1 Tax=Mycolicibacterium lutetiense TaxID=1641992 RepID=A0ABS4ZVW5_9MYCO|nr:hypothetical protein [Mycolicibacterium lutetiense]MBP2453657.1 Sec-independent protein translocase protein TatA [Mycolicibacterium lutetiense]